MAETLATITPDPLVIRKRIRQLTDELKLARRLLAITMHAQANVKQHVTNRRTAVGHE
jgi:hypothetical protein